MLIDKYYEIIAFRPKKNQVAVIVNDITQRKLAEEKITFQLEIAKNFKGKTVFIAGNHDWYNGIEGLEAQSKFVTDYLEDKKAFLPRNSCGIERLKINDDVVMITIDSQWFLEDWNNYPTINDDCEIKTKEAFFEEVKSLLNKHQNQTVILAIRMELLPSEARVYTPVTSMSETAP